MVCSAITFPSYATLNYAYIPVTAYACQIEPPIQEGGISTQLPFLSASDEVSTIDSICKEINASVEIRVMFPVYVMSLCSFLGWLMIIFFLPTGMWAYVFEFIAEFVTRPKKMQDDEFNREKAALQK